MSILSVNAAIAAATASKPITSTNPVKPFQALLEENNSPILEKQAKKQEKDALMMERIREMGLDAYAREQRKIEKLMKILHTLADTPNTQVRGFLQKIIQHFEEHPPRTAEEMMKYITAAVADIAPDAPNNFREIMERVLDQIREMMQLSDDQLAQKIAATEKNIDDSGLIQP